MIRKRLAAVAATLVATISLTNFLIPAGTVRAALDSAVQVNYCTHVQNIGWQNPVANGDVAGTEGQSLRLEALKVTLSTDMDLGIEYRSHIQNIGWEETWHANGDMSGTEGQSLRLEALEIRLTGSEAANYDVWYCTHVQNIGWMDWVCNGERSGTEGFGLRQEGLAIVILPKGSPAPANIAGVPGTPAPSNDPVPLANGLSYSTHVQNIGWQEYVAAGSMAGTTGQSLRLEGIKINLTDIEGVSVQYKTHIQNIGWESTWKNNNELSGTSGQSLRLEAIEIQLTGPNAANYDIYYRTHIQNIGWSDWAYNGNPCGSAGYSYRLEAIEIQILPVGSPAPGSTNVAFYQPEGAAPAEVPLAVSGDLSNFPANVQPYVNTLSDPDFEASIAAFPDTYKPYLRALHAEHPSWTFSPVDCGSWENALNLETRDGVSLAANARYQDPNRPQVVDAGGWRNASRECVAFYLDPRNSFTTTTVFQFLDLHNPGNISAEAVSAVTSGTYLVGLETTIYTAGQNSNLNPLFVASHAIQECGVNGSASSNGTNGVYNHFNIGATNGDGAVSRGLNFAANGINNPNYPDFNARYNIPWTSPDLSLTNGSRWISNNYTAQGQNTIYFMRFNTRLNNCYSIGGHQYMCATASARNEGIRMANGYTSSGLINNSMTFYIPVYSGLPAAPSPDPGQN